jgi:hypothetical protein
MGWENNEECRARKDVNIGLSSVTVHAKESRQGAIMSCHVTSRYTHRETCKLAAMSYVTVYVSGDM